MTLGIIIITDELFQPSLSWD